MLNSNLKMELKTINTWMLTLPFTPHFSLKKYLYFKSNQCKEIPYMETIGNFMTSKHSAITLEAASDNLDAVMMLKWSHCS